MDDFRKQFLSDARGKLDKLLAELEISETGAFALKGELLRILHTIKGSAQAFGYVRPAVLAHALEQFVSSQKIEIGSKTDLQKRLLLLKNSLANSQLDDIQKRFNQPGEIAPTGNDPINSLYQKTANFPAEFVSKLSSQEKILVISEVDEGKTLYSIEIVFKGSDFADKLKTARGVLSKSANIVAAIPASNFGRNAMFGFQFLLAAHGSDQKIEKIARKFDGKVLYRSDKFSRKLDDAIELAVSHGRAVAKKLGKNVEFEVSNDRSDFPLKLIKLIFESLLHIIRNAVDHAFDETGKVRIRIDSNDDGFLITVSDDGKGIDPTEIRAIAKKLLICADIDNMTEEATLALIFQSEFSTASEVSEISGRGVGLDSVKTSIENAGGTISVKRNFDFGTSFEIFLPKSL